MDQCPEVGSPTSEAQPSCLVGAARAFHPHGFLTLTASHPSDHIHTAPQRSRPQPAIPEGNFSHAPSDSTLNSDPDTIHNKDPDTNPNLGTDTVLNSGPDTTLISATDTFPKYGPDTTRNSGTDAVSN